MEIFVLKITNLSNVNNFKSYCENRILNSLNIHILMRASRLLHGYSSYGEKQFLLEQIRTKNFWFKNFKKCSKNVILLPSLTLVRRWMANLPTKNEANNTYVKNII